MLAHAAAQRAASDSLSTSQSTLSFRLCIMVTAEARDPALLAATQPWKTPLQALIDGAIVTNGE